MSWRRLGVLLRGLPMESRTVRALHGEVWDADTHLLASILDALNGANWQRSGQKSNRPKPLSRPGMKDDESDSVGTAIPLNELRRRLHPEQFTDEGGD